MAAPLKPFVYEIPFEDPWQAFLKIQHHAPFATFLDSAMTDNEIGAYSFIAADPFQILSAKDKDVFIDDFKFSGNPYDVLATEMQKFQLETLENLPPFQGGLAGYLGYDLIRHQEALPAEKPDTLNIPDIVMGFFDVVVAFDLVASKGYIFSSGLPERREEKREQRAQKRARQIQQHLRSRMNFPARPSHELNWQADLSRHRYESRVQEIINHIWNGTFSQCNLTCRWQTDVPMTFDPLGLYASLREQNPAPFAGFMRHGKTHILSSSPERLLKTGQGRIECRPIKGTVKRDDDPETDELQKRWLESDDKNRAENVMIVDLLRNDISKICEDRSVDVPWLCRVETYENLHHLVSVVRGRLRENVNPTDIIQAVFPGGSITGAPKIRAMELIEHYESQRRGPFYGSLGYIGFNGAMDLNILIRSFVQQGQKLTFQVGGGIVADSQPAAEFDEMMLKARALFSAAEPARQAA